MWLTRGCDCLRYLMLTAPGAICDPACLSHASLAWKQMLHQSDDSHSGVPHIRRIMATFGLGRSCLQHCIMRLLLSSKCLQACESSTGHPPISARYSCDVARQPHRHPAVASSRQQCRAAGDPVDLQVSRRELLQQTVFGAGSLWGSTLAGGVLPPPAQAGLVSFPAADLKNTYWLVSCCSPLFSIPQDDMCRRVKHLGLQVRAGEGQCEHDGYVLSNTVYKTSVSSGLSTDGKRQVVKKVSCSSGQA